MAQGHSVLSALPASECYPALRERALLWLKRRGAVMLPAIEALTSWSALSYTSGPLDIFVDEKALEALAGFGTQIVNDIVGILEADSLHTVSHL